MHASTELSGMPQDASVGTAERVHGIGELAVESRVKRLFYLGLAIVLMVVFFSSAMCYWACCHAGVDQNGYLVGGKQFAYTLSMAQRPRELSDPNQFDPHQLISAMWVVGTDDHTIFFPKYPLGMPLLVAICIWIGGLEWGPWGSYLLSPVAMTLALLGIFLMTRRFTGSFPALLAMIVFATSPTTGNLTNNPNSHATCVFCVVWGLWLAMRYMDTGKLMYGMIGGFLTGYAFTIRYTEGLLILPLLWLAVMGVRSFSLRSLARALVPAISWAIPVVALLVLNYIQIGTWTGYDATNESSGFSWNYFYDNWETILRAMNTGGIFFIFPLAIVGLIAMFWWNWKWAIFFWLWAGPTMTLYTFYYWAPDGDIATGYLRFFITILPPMLVAGFWVLIHAKDFLHSRPQRLPTWGIVAVMIGAGVVVAIAGHYALRWDFGTKDRRMIPTEEFLGKLESPGKYAIEATVFYCGLLSITVFGAAIAGSMFLRKKVVPTLAAGIIAALSGAVQLDNTTRQAERENYERNVLLVNVNEVMRYCPAGSIIISREENLTRSLQFQQDYRIYQGLSFDRNWVNNQPRDNTPEAQLIDPARNRALFDALANQDQKSLDESVRRLVREAWENHRRVFVIDSPKMEDIQKSRREKAELPTPEFIRRYLMRQKEFAPKQLVWWNVPPPFKDEDKRPGHRGRRGDRPGYRNFTMQIWEVARPI